MENLTIPGIVLIRSALTTEEKDVFYNIIWKNAVFFEEDGVTPNYITKRFTRGRDGFLLKNLVDGELLQPILEKLRLTVESIDETLKFDPPTYVLMQYYPVKKGIARHNDGHGGNNGDEGAPVYSLSLGSTCNFRYWLVGTEDKPENKTEYTDLLLNSGDLLVFGGPQRLINHEVLSVNVGSCDEEGCRGARINLTFRTCTGFTDADELRYKTKNYLEAVRQSYVLKNQENAKKLQS